MKSTKESDKWWKKFFINGLNYSYKNIYVSYLEVGNESRSAIRFHTKVKGILAHLSYIF